MTINEKISNILNTGKQKVKDNWHNTMPYLGATLPSLSELATTFYENGTFSLPSEHLGEVLVETILFTLAGWGIKKTVAALKKEHIESDRLKQYNEDIVDNIPSLVVILDPSKNGEIVTVNKYTEQVLGYKKEEIVGLFAESFLEESDKPRYKIELYNNKDTFTTEYSVKTKDGQKKLITFNTVEMRGNNGNHFILLTGEDITEKRKAEYMLAGTFAKLSELEEVISQSPIVSFRWKGDENSTVKYGHNVEKEWGYNLKEFVSGKLKFMDIVYPEDKERVREEIKVAIESKNYNPVTEYRIIKKNGEIIWVRDQTHIEIDNNEKTEEHFGTIIDITKNKELEILLKTINQKKDKFFSIVSHDLRSPLNHIMGYAEILKDEITEKYPNDQELIDVSNTLKLASHSYYEILKNILEWSRNQMGNVEYNPRECDMKLVVNNGIKYVSDTAKRKEISVENKVPIALKGWFDEGSLTSIMSNLLMNSVKFSSPKTKISVESYVDKLEDDNLYAYITVQDQGKGMSKEKAENLFNKDNIFNKSERGTSGESGIGIGLINCRDMVYDNGGKIWAESEPGVGTKITFTVPMFEYKQKKQNGNINSQNSNGISYKTTNA